MEFGAARRANDAAEVASCFDVGEELGGEVSADGVGDGVEGAEAADGGVVGDVDGLLGSEGEGLVDLRGADAGDDVDAELQRAEEGQAADAAECAGEEDGLARLRVSSVADELVGSGGDDGKCGGGVEVDAVGNLCDAGDVGGDELGIGVGGAAKDAIAGRETGDAFAAGANDSGEVKTENGGEGYWKDFARYAGAHLPVDGVDSGGVNFDEELVGAGGGCGDVFVVQVGGWTVLVQDNSFHFSPQRGEMRGEGGSLLNVRAGRGR